MAAENVLSNRWKFKRRATVGCFPVKMGAPNIAPVTLPRLTALFIGLVCFASLSLGQTLPRASFSSATSPARGQDPATWSLKGLRLHMTPQEALPILRALGEAAFYSQPCVNEKIADLKAGRSPAYDGSCIFRIQMGPDIGSKLRVILQFTEDLPKGAGTMRLWHIDVTQGGFTTEADRGAALSAVREKYGPPSTIGRDFLIYCGGPGNKVRCQREDFLSGGGFTIFSDLSHFANILFTGAVYPPDLPSIGLYAYTSEFFSELNIDLYDGALRFQTAREEKKLVDQTRTVQKPTL